jgi:hypothetical protein
MVCFGPIGDIHFEAACARFYFASGLVSLCGRQNELEPRAAFAVRRRRQLTAVLLSDHAANRESQSHSVRLRRKKRCKYFIHFLRISTVIALAPSPHSRFTEAGVAGV